MSLGSIILRIRQRFGHGLRTAWYRDIVRSRILATTPVTGTTDATCEIHVLTSSQDRLNLMWALKSFYAASGRRYALCIHDDGTVGEKAGAELWRHFPNARFISRDEADTSVLPILKPFPRSLAFRQINPLSPKVFDFSHFLRGDRMLLLDSDVLFFREPTEFLRRIEDPKYRKNTVNADIASAYTVDSAVAKAQTGVRLVERFNSGLGLIHRESLNLESVEGFLGLPGIREGHFWRIEQTIYALCSSRFGVELLPADYDVRLGPGINGSPCRHYVGAIRHLLYGEGIRYLVRNRLLNKSTV